MKTRLFKLLILTLLFCAAIPVSAQLDDNGRIWIPVSKISFADDMEIEGIRTNATLNDKVKFEFSNSDKRLIIDANKWQYYIKGGKAKFDLLKTTPDKDGYYYVDFEKLFGSQYPFVYLQSRSSSRQTNNALEVLISANWLPYVDANYYFAVRQIWPTVVDEYRKLAQSSSDKDVLFSFATLLEAGDDSEQKEAFEWWKKLDEAGDSRAVSHLAMYYIEGKYVKQDITKAQSMLLLADDSDVRAKNLADNLAKNHQQAKEGEWEVRYEGFAFASIKEALQKLDLYDPDSPEIFNQTLRVNRESKAFYNDYLARLPEDLSGSQIRNDSNLQKIYRWLRGGECDWLWVYMGNPNNMAKLYKYPALPWLALGFNCYIGKIEQFSKYIERLCDIALQTNDIKLMKEIAETIFNTKFDLGRFGLIEVDPVAILLHKAKKGWQEGECYSINSITDQTIKDKFQRILKRGVDLGIEKFDRMYEEYYLNNL